jgi:titin
MPSSHPRRPPRLRLEPLEAREVPAVVTATNDVDDYDPATPANWAGPDGKLSLPEAIREVNAELGGTIDFAVNTVTLTQPLRPVTVPVTITGLFAGGRPGTTIDGAGVAGGITLTAGGTVRDLVVQNFAGSYGMSIAGAANVNDCFFGTSADGLAAAGNAGAGLVIKSGTVQNSVFAGNAGDGLQVTGTATVTGSLFGTDVSGLTALPNSGDGLVLTGPASVVRGNVLSGNAANGLSVKGALAVGNKVLGNKVGIGSDGSTAVPNQVGVFIGSGARGTVVGGASSVDPSARTVIAGNTSHGVWLERAGVATTILGNWIGVAGTGTTPVPNGGNGVFVHITGSAVVGGTAVGAGNVIAANGGAGVRIEGVPGQFPATRANRVLGNWIGLDAGQTAAGNGTGGVVVAGGAAANTVGGTVLAARNVISGNAVAGITLTDVGTTGTLIQGNFIGTDVLGSAARPNEYGVQIVNGASANAVGGGVAAARNLISGNSKAGVYVAGLTATSSAPRPTARRPWATPRRACGSTGPGARPSAGRPRGPGT